MSGNDSPEIMLPSLSLKRSYRTGDDPLNNFYIPCLSHGIKYDRAAGFFDSKSLAIAAKGIAGLINNGGSMRMVCSPRFNNKDLETLQDLSDDPDEVIEHTLLRGIDPEKSGIEEYLRTDRFKCLAWMLDQGHLEIKVAYMPADEQKNPYRMYHEKLGLITDNEKNRVAFSGSINETKAGWTENYESFEVFRSWIGEEDKRIQDKQDAFDRLWTDQDPEVNVHALPEAVKNSVTKRAPETIDGKPALNLFLTEEGTNSYDDEEMELWPHQQEAINWWREHDYRGILAMATGTGKTYTALRAARLQADTRLTIIVVPTKVLIDQWIGQLKEVFGNETSILECTGRVDWRQQILEVVDPYRLGELSEIANEGRAVLITTPHTASSSAFRRAVKHIPDDRVQIIVDEVHNVGSEQFRKTLEIDADRRLGLSATPNRQWDEEGTQIIYKYFGGQDPFRFTTKEAIENGYLVEYDYHPLLCELTADEYDEYLAFTKELGQVEAQLHNTESPPQRLHERKEQILRDRAQIKKRAFRKPGRFGKFLDTDHPTPAIVFCEDNDQIDEIQKELDQREKRYAVYVSDRPDEQGNAFHKFETGAIDYLLAIRCLDEGVDVPDCPTAIIISSSTNTREFIQRRGRILRTSDQKDHAVIYDLFVLPGINAQPGDPTAKKIIEQELRRAKLLMNAARNRSQAEVQLANDLAEYGDGFKSLVYATDAPDVFEGSPLEN